MSDSQRVYQKVVKSLKKALKILVLKEKKWDLFDHTRQDKSLFRLGVDWLDRTFNQGLSFRAISHIRGVM